MFIRVHPWLRLCELNGPGSGAPADSSKRLATPHFDSPSGREYQQSPLGTRRFPRLRGLRDFHAKCVKIPRGVRSTLRNCADFTGENAVAPTVLKIFSKRVDRKSEFPRVRPLFAENNNQPRKVYEDIQQKGLKNIREGKKFKIEKTKRR